MGRYHRMKPLRLAEKMLDIRLKLGLSQNGMIDRLNLTGVITQSRISGYELGTREPALPVCCVMPDLLVFQQTCLLMTISNCRSKFLPNSRARVLTDDLRTTKRAHLTSSSND